MCISDSLYYKLASNAEAAAAFFEGILPEDMKEETKKAAPVNAQPGLKVLEAPVKGTEEQ